MSCFNTLTPPRPESKTAMGEVLILGSLLNDSFIITENASRHAIILGRVVGSCVLLKGEISHSSALPSTS